MMQTVQYFQRNTNNQKLSVRYFEYNKTIQKFLVTYFQHNTNSQEPLIRYFKLNANSSISSITNTPKHEANPGSDLRISEYILHKY